MDIPVPTSHRSSRVHTGWLVMRETELMWGGGGLALDARLRESLSRAFYGPLYLGCRAGVGSWTRLLDPRDPSARGRTGWSTGLEGGAPVG